MAVQSGSGARPRRKRGAGCHALPNRRSAGRGDLSGCEARAMHAPSEPPSSDSGAAVSAIEECDYLIERFRREASKNQKLAWSASIAIGFSSALIPVSIVVSTELGAFVFGKLMPSLLAALAAIAAGAAQIVRPHDRWRLNRRHQRLLEAERMIYVHQIDDYAAGNRDELLLHRLAAVRRSVIEEWLTIIPADTAKALAEARQAPANQ